MLVLRFGNPMFGAVWDCNHIDNVQVSALEIRLGSSPKLNAHQISMTEAIGTEGRGGYFDDVGVIRDIMQNRKSVFFVCFVLMSSTTTDLTQILALITMERPGSFSAEDLRQEKVSSLLIHTSFLS